MTVMVLLQKSQYTLDQETNTVICCGLGEDFLPAVQFKTNKNSVTVHNVNSYILCNLFQSLSKYFGGGFDSVENQQSIQNNPCVIDIDIHYIVKIYYRLGKCRVLLKHKHKQHYFPLNEQSVNSLLFIFPILDQRIQHLTSINLTDIYKDCLFAAIHCPDKSELEFSKIIIERCAGDVIAKIALLEYLIYYKNNVHYDINLYKLYNNK